ncbi:unnamed protein product [Didymodactylos carnosus]|uniref:Uncharacterized protein n=1 Tax=Didymodactylos carnosus TaxID=1234261 RepID=A0A814MR93_9BILA|nr:unnamed protein product [Didymodactylos carnosus]CAF1206038.1 unnamed protein product [Didymodactylos carnosus]CAF3848069.1 unnamed protein product [Didymodactylos carnosus]CAF4015381.1 unnamed protein product [Didymodactylos carnosus]
MERKLSTDSQVSHTSEVSTNGTRIRATHAVVLYSRDEQRTRLVMKLSDVSNYVSRPKVKVGDPIFLKLPTSRERFSGQIVFLG